MMTIKVSIGKIKVVVVPLCSRPPWRSIIFGLQVERVALADGV
jgi:hypothetical protein